MSGMLALTLSPGLYLTVVFTDKYWKIILKKEKKIYKNDRLIPLSFDNR
jgi:hypothetical protein